RAGDGVGIVRTDPSSEGCTTIDEAAEPDGYARNASPIRVEHLPAQLARRLEGEFDHRRRLARLDLDLRRIEIERPDFAFSRLHGVLARRYGVESAATVRVSLRRALCEHDQWGALDDKPRNVFRYQHDCA